MNRKLIAGSILAVSVAAIGGILLYSGAGPQAAVASPAALSSAGAPTLGERDARVHIVEFMDPACETCADFYPFVKQMMQNQPGRIRLSVRHIAFHQGADEAVRMLEAARAQDKYFVALEALLAGQSRWVRNHRVVPGAVATVLQDAGLDMQRLRSDMESPEVAARIAQDLADARALGVSATPEYFVNGRPLPKFGYEELASLVKSELARAYR
jgi:protein-disulfide isomerase